ncbi:hypothetical protein CEUSTIGMA_g11824.t1 [Chlamydomonas eustigma]|uniref:5'-nucleotidase n=1 Tax=Chlamydomonas eustigma TaxID=1157962 RepID=A0A250XNB3_9CHLO|nr:hypothetical protein CEUSTIGMA_g11824.t1 [Chlamydomonas eustigma]|eukprot:GAX84402.1 hypothetical protein CEUSTIGMA_g11824.t1 [Chlamydomonas eustigma]
MYVDCRGMSYQDAAKRCFCVLRQTSAHIFTCRISKTAVVISTRQNLASSSVISCKVVSLYSTKLCTQKTLISSATSSSSQVTSPVTHEYGSAPPPQPGQHPEWWSQVLTPTPLPAKRRIYCNRALNMKQIKAIGFDMDYTLAQYRPETFEALAHKETIEKLVHNFKYPEELRSLKFQWDYMVKGLIIDKNRGNTLKVDRHRYVKVAYHGLTPLPNDVRKTVYNSGQFDQTFEEPDYAMVDTLFSLAEAYLFMQLVEMKDEHKYGILTGKAYSELYRDLRTAVDLCHRDGSLKKAVTADPCKFIHYDPLLPQTIGMLRASGRKVCIATNSLWDFTNVVMNYLILGKSGASKSFEWLSCFDLVMVGCGKPAFFQGRGQLFSVDIKTGYLRNMDNGAPTMPLETPEPSPVATSQLPEASTSTENGHHQMNSDNGRPWAPVYQGGSYKDLHRMLNVRSGDEMLYIGDHILGDIVTSKKSVGWRTMLVVPELDVDLSLEQESKRVHRELRLLRDQRDVIDDQVERFEWALKQDTMPTDPIMLSKNLELLKELKLRKASLKERHSNLLANLHRKFHPIWGQLLKTGHQNSRFANQMERFACLYTSHVSNLAFYSPEKSYRGGMDYMAHEGFEDDFM